MADPDDRFEATVSELTNALQAAVLIAARLAPDAAALREAVERGASAAEQLSPGWRAAGVDWPPVARW